jgi:hypothetical protein
MGVSQAHTVAAKHHSVSVFFMFAVSAALATDLPISPARLMEL